LPAAPDDHAREEFTIRELVGCIIEYLDAAISKMASNPDDPVLADLRWAAPLIRDVHRRIENALEAR
jgi:hypothetical protein